MSPVIPLAHREPPHSRWQSGEGGEDQAQGHPRQLLLSARLPDGSDRGRAFFRPAAWQSSALSPLSPPVGDSPAIFFIFSKVSSLLGKNTALSLEMASHSMGFSYRSVPSKYMAALSISGCAEGD